MRILFINSHTGSGTIPLASACLAAVLEHRFGDKVSCPILEPAPGFSIDNTVREILSGKPDLIALTLYSWSRVDLLTLSAALLDASGDWRPPIIAGGPEVTADPSAIQGHPAIDLAVSGEGEGPIITIVEKLLPLSPDARLTGLTDFPTPFTQSPVEDLDVLPSPWNAAALEGRIYEDTVWELTRGCPFGCHFCFESKGSGRVRHKSISRAASELKQLQDRGTGNVFLLDPTFNASPDRAKELMKLFISQAPELNYHMEVRTEFLDEEQAELYAELGCTLQIGLQTAHPDIARNIGRPFSPEQFREKLLPLHENGVPYGLDLIYGLPGDSQEGFRQSLDFALSCAPNHLDIFPLSVLPGTRLRETAGGLGLHYLVETPYTVTGNRSESGGFSSDDLSAAAALTAAIDELYNKGRAVPWFLITAEALGLRPVEIMDAYLKDRTENSGETAADESGRPARLGTFIRKLAEKTGHSNLGPILEDLACLLTVESANREGLQLPASLTFTHSPRILMEHLDMGISDIDELAAFVPEKPGNYRPVPTEDDLNFTVEKK